MARILRVSIVGALPSGEEWSVNPVWNVGGDFGVPVPPATAQTIATAIAAVAVPAGITGIMVPASTLSGCRVEARGYDGTLESQAEAAKATPTVGTGTSAHPFQTALVTSLRTTTPGPRGRGRLFWPANGILISATTLRPSAGNVSTILGGVKTYLSGVQSAISASLTGVSLVVWSRTGASVANVTSIQAGDVLDVQRRRRDQLVESVTALPYP